MFHRFPRLKVALSEGGIGWVPYMLERIDYTWERHKHYTGVNLDIRPSDLFRTHIWGCFIDDEAGHHEPPRHRHRPDHVGVRLPALRLELAAAAGSAPPRCSPTSPTTRSTGSSS